MGDTKSYSCRSFIHPPRFHGLEQSSHYSVASVNKSHPCFSAWSRGHQHTARALSSHAANSILCPSWCCSLLDHIFCVWPYSEFSHVISQSEKRTKDTSNPSRASATLQTYR